MGPPTDSLGKLSFEELDSVLQKFPRRYDIPVEYSRRAQLLFSRRVYELPQLESENAEPDNFIEMRKKLLRKKLDSNGLGDGPYPPFGILEGVSDSEVAVLALRTRFFDQRKQSRLPKDPQLLRIVAAITMAGSLTAGQTGYSGHFENRYAVCVQTLNGLQTDSLFDIAYDPLDGSLYVSSLKANMIYRGIRFDSCEWDFTPFTITHANGMGTPQGLLIDNQRRILWTLSTEPDALFGFSLVTGKPLYRVDAPKQNQRQGFHSLCLVQDSLLFITASTASRVYRYRISQLLDTLEIVTEEIFFPRAIAYLPVNKMVYVASQRDGMYTFNPDTLAVKRVEWKRAVTDAGMRKLHTLPRGVLLGLHDSYGPTRAVRYTIDSIGTVVQHVRPGRITFLQSIDYISSDTYGDTVFSLMKHEKTMIYSGKDSIEIGVPGVQVNVDLLPLPVEPVAPLQK